MHQQQRSAAIQQLDLDQLVRVATALRGGAGSFDGLQFLIQKDDRR